MNKILARYLLAILLVTLWVGTQSSQEPGPAKEAFGYRFLYADKLTPKEFLTKNPCVSGGWRFKSETKTHWIGVLNYPTGNVAPAYPAESEPAFVVEPIKIEKQKGLEVDLKTYQ